jgi:hypothetical protein
MKRIGENIRDLGVGGRIVLKCIIETEVMDFCEHG